MSIVIKGLSIPADHHQRYIDVRIHYTEEKAFATVAAGEHPYWKKLDVVNLPDHHGRLGDLDALIVDVMDRGIEGLQTDDWNEFQQTIMEQPTIFEAEDE